MFKLALKPQWIAFFLLALLLATMFVFLSRWQISSSISARTEADPAKNVVRPYTEVMQEHTALDTARADTVVSATGHYVAGSSYLVENKLNDGQEGFWVVSEFVPSDSGSVTYEDGASSPRAIAVARAWSSSNEIPAEPTGEVTVAGRVVGNDTPYYSNRIEEEHRGQNRVIGSAAAAQLSNLWEAPLYSGILTADAEVPAGEQLPLTETGELDPAASLIDPSGELKPVRAEQVTNDSVNWLNIFYGIEWIVFAGFALYLWWRMLKDAYEKEQNPSQFFEYEGEYWLDEATGKYYYWDPADRQYYFFDELPQQGKPS